MLVPAEFRRRPVPDHGSEGQLYKKHATVQHHILASKHIVAPPDSTRVGFSPALLRETSLTSPPYSSPLVALYTPTLASARVSPFSLVAMQV